MSALLSGLKAYGYIGIMVFLLLVAYRLVRMLQGKPFIPAPERSSPFYGWTAVELCMLLLAVTIVAWPGAVYVFFFMREKPRG